MISQHKLKSLGFTSFVYPKHLKKDDFNRMIYSCFFEDGDVLIRVIDKNDDDNWKIEKLEINGSKAKETFNGNESDLESLLAVVKILGAN